MTIEEFIKVQDKQQYRHLGLFTRTGEAIIKFNTVKMKPATRLDQIKTRLESPTLKDSAYIIKGKSYLSNDTKSDDYIISKEGSEPINIIEPEPLNNVDGYSFKKALEIEIELKHSQMELAQFKKENKELLEELEECNKTLAEYEEEEENKLSENNTPNWQTFISESLATITPIIDKHMELKERAILLQENKLLQPPTITPNNTEVPNDKVNNDFNKEVLDTINDEVIQFINSEQDQQKKETLINCYEQSKNLEHLIVSLNEIDPQIMSQISNNLNNR